MTIILDDRYFYSFLSIYTILLTGLIIFYIKKMER